MHRIRLRLQLIQERAQYRRHEMEHRDPISLHCRDDLARVAFAPRLQQRDARACDCPPHQLPHSHIECHRRLVQDDVVGSSQYRRCIHSSRFTTDRVLDFHTLRPAGGSRRVNDVGEVRRRGDRFDGIRPGGTRLDAADIEFGRQFSYLAPATRTRAPLSSMIVRMRSAG